MDEGIQQDQFPERHYPGGITMKLLYCAVAALLLYIIAWVVWLYILAALIRTMTARSHRFAHRNGKHTVALQE